MSVATGKSAISRVVTLAIALVLAFSLTVGEPARAYAAADRTQADLKVAALQTEAVKVPSTSAYKKLVKNLQARFGKGGKSAAIDNSSVDAAFALKLLGAKSEIDVSSVRGMLDSAEGIGAGTMAKYVIIFKLAGSTADAKSCLAQVESLMTADEGVYDATWILMAYHLMGEKPGSSAALSESQLASAVTATQVDSGMFGGEWWSTQTTAQAVMALKGVSSAEKARAKGVKALKSAQRSDGGFYYDAWSLDASSVDATGEVVLALYYYAKEMKDYEAASMLAKAAGYLAGAADSTLDGYVDAGSWNETMTCASAFAGLAAAKAAASLKFPLSKASVAKIGKLKYTGKAVKPTITVASNGVKLKKGTDYKVSYLNKNKKAIKASKVKTVGKYYVKVTGQGNFTGTVTKAFKITKK